MNNNRESMPDTIVQQRSRATKPRIAWQGGVIAALLGVVALAAIYHVLSGKDIAKSPLLDTMSWWWLILLFIELAFAIKISSSKYHRIDVFSPWISFPLFYFMIYGIGGIRWIVENKKGAGGVMFLAAAGLLSYYVGSNLVPLNRKHTENRGIWNANAVRTFVMFLTAIGFIGATLFYAKAGIPILSNSLQGRLEAIDRAGNIVLYIARLSAIAYMLYLTQWIVDVKNMRLRSTIALITFFLLISAFMFSTGNRNDVFFIWFMTILVYYNSRDKSDVISVTSRSLLLASIVFLYGFLRLVLSEPERLDYFAETAYNYGLQTGNIGAFLVYGFYQLSVYPENFLLILNWVPEFASFFYGKTFLMTLTTALPGKQIAVGEFLKEQFGLTFSGGGINPTMLGELYLDFGSPYVLLMLFLYGIIARSLYDKMLRSRTSANILLYSFSVYCFVLSTTGGLFSQLSRWYYLVVLVASITIVGKMSVRANRLNT